MQTDVAPTRPQERVDELDFIRGLALFGIFLMNLPSFAIAFDESWLEPGIPGKTWLDQAALLLQDVLLAGKFNSMFSLLFAIGFTLQLERLHTALPAGKADLVYVRRLLFLLALGVAHYLVFWNGDILHTYALLGFLLLWLRRWSDRELLLLALGCIVAPTLVDVWRYLHLSAADLQRMMEDSIERSRAAEVIWQHGSVMQTISLTLREGVRQYHGARQLVGQFGAYTLILTTLCLGLIIGRNHWYRDLGVRLPALIRWQWIALAIGLTTGGVVGLSDYLWTRETPVTALSVAARICFSLSRLALTAFYVLTFLRLLQHGVWRERLRPLALAGRMALTTYLTQTVFGLCMFYGWGFGFRGQLGLAAQFGVCILFFTLVQVPFSTWWFKRFQYGPLEYLWRAATYGRWESFRVRPAG